MSIIDSSPTLSMVWPHNSHTSFDIYTPIKVMFALPNALERNTVTFLPEGIYNPLPIHNLLKFPRGTRRVWLNCGREVPP